MRGGRGHDMPTLPLPLSHYLTCIPVLRVAEMEALRRTHAVELQRISDELANLNGSAEHRERALARQLEAERDKRVQHLFEIGAQRACATPCFAQHDCTSPAEMITSCCPNARSSP